MTHPGERVQFKLRDWVTEEAGTVLGLPGMNWRQEGNAGSVGDAWKMLAAGSCHLPVSRQCLPLAKATSSKLKWGPGKPSLPALL